MPMPPRSTSQDQSFEGRMVTARQRHEDRIGDGDDGPGIGVGTLFGTLCVGSRREEQQRRQREWGREGASGGEQHGNSAVEGGAILRGPCPMCQRRSRLHSLPFPQSNPSTMTHRPAPRSRTSAWLALAAAALLFACRPEAKAPEVERTRFPGTPPTASPVASRARSSDGPSLPPALLPTASRAVE